MKQEKGFTLIEVLVASALTALVGIMAYSFLNAAMSAFEVHRNQAGRLDEVNLFFTLLSRDITHVVDRPIINEFSQPEAPVQGGPGDVYLLSLTRGGRLSPRYVVRSDLQRVAYQFQDNKVLRAGWPMLDRIESGSDNNAGVYSATALSNVSEASVHFLRQQDIQINDRELARQWTERWPLPNAASAVGVNVSPFTKELPVAIEIRLVLDDLGEMKRIFALPNQPLLERGVN